MAATSSLAIVAFAVAALFVIQAESLRCYTCSTATNKNCIDPFNKTYVSMTDCQAAGTTGTAPKEVAFCKKSKQRVNNGELQTVRSCVWARPDEACQPSPPAAYIREEECYVCNTDLCNGAANFQASLLPLFAVAAAAIYSTL